MSDDVCVPCFLKETAQLDALKLSKASGAGKKAARLGDIGGGHGCFPPTPIIMGSLDVLINHRPAARLSDPVLLHACGNCPPHPRNISAGSGTVLINNKKAARASDAINCGGSISTGSGDVLIGETGVKGPDQDCLKAAKKSGAAFAQPSPAMQPPPEPPAMTQPPEAIIGPAESGAPFIA